MKRPGTNIISSVGALAISVAIPTSAGLAIGLRRRRPEARMSDWNRILSESPLHRVVAAVSGEGGRRPRSSELTENAQSVTRQSAKLIGGLGDTVRADFGPRARVASERAADVAGKLGTKGRTLASDLGERWQSEIGPVAKSWAQEALDEAEDILKTARERGADLATTAREEYVPQLSTKTSQVGHVITATSAGAAQMLGNRLSGRRGRRLPAPERVRKQVVSGVSGTLHQVGNQTKHVAIETTMIGAWTTALGMVIYYGLLTPEQREQLMTFLTGAYEQGREAIRDLKGEPSEF